MISVSRIPGRENKRKVSDRWAMAINSLVTRFDEGTALVQDLHDRHPA